MPRIVLTTLNARYAHASFGLRYILANLGPMAADAALLEFDISIRPSDALESILRLDPKIVAIGIYIWNITPATQLVAELKRIRPHLPVIIGGPQVSYETDTQEICRLADYTLTGEADLEFPVLCQSILDGRPPATKVIAAPVPDLGKVALPYDLYNDADIAHRVIYVEASRGCPFTCEFCLSSLDIPVRNVPLPEFLGAMQRLLDRGVRQLKFVDRTFNLNLKISESILKFFLERYTPNLFLHFEMIPDRLPPSLRDLIAQFPPGSLQFEVGVQSFNPAVCELISRRQDTAKLEDNLRFLRTQTGVHIHADLIAGLPGEDLPSFAAGFDRLVALNPHEIQVGLLKRLPGTPIVRHDGDWHMAYSPHAPFEVLQTKLLDFPTLQRLKRFSRYWDLVANSGNFVQSTPLLWKDSSPFTAFLNFSDWLFSKIGITHNISLNHLAERLFEYLTTQRNLPPATAAQSIASDYHRTDRRDAPDFLRPWLPSTLPPRHRAPSGQARRQELHRGGAGQPQ